MRKAFTLILIFVLLAAGTAMVPALLQSNVAFAETTTAICADNATVHRGQAFTVDVKLEANEGLTALMLLVKYDASAMRLQSADKGDALRFLTYRPAGQSVWETQNQDDGIRFYWYGAMQPDTSVGTLLTLTFESFADAPVGDYELQISYNPDDTRSMPYVPAEVATQNGVVTLEKGEYRVKYYDYDGNEIVELEQDYNDPEAVPDMSGIVPPTRETDTMYEYEFSHWQAVVSDEAHVLKYQAVYNLTPVEYIVWFYVDGELYALDSGFYGRTLPFPDTYKQDYTFIGWFVDEECTQRLTSTTMPANDRKEWFLYGYYRYNIREQNVPELMLSVADRQDNLYTIEAVFTVNTGVFSMKLSLNYDKQYLTFLGFQAGDAFDGAMNFSPDDVVTLGSDGYYRATAGGDLSAYPFVFTFDQSGFKNYTGCELVLRMQFRLAAQAPDGAYGVTFLYNSGTDISYFNDVGELWMTDVKILAAQISKGEQQQQQNHWSGSPAGDSSVVVDVTSSEGMPAQTELAVRDVSSSLQLSSSATDTIGDGKEVKNAYSIDLMLNGVTVQPSGALDIRIKLKDTVKGKNPILYILGEDGSLTLVQSTVSGDELVFSVSSLGTFVIVGDKDESTPPDSGDKTDPPIDDPNPNPNPNPTPNDDGPLDGLPWMYIAFAAAGVAVLMLIILIIVAAKKKKRVYDDDDDDEDEDDD